MFGDDEVDDANLDAGFRRVVRVGHGGDELEFEVIVVLDFLVALLEYLGFANDADLRREDGLKLRRHFLIHVFDDQPLAEFD